MTTNPLLSDLLSRETLAELEGFLHDDDDQALLSQRLFELLMTVAEYRDAREWAAAVRVCEALAIVGWGTRERVDARSHFNGDCWDTFFINSREEHRFRTGRWRKRKGGWVLFNPEYHASPDRPGMPDQSWKRSPA